MIELLLLLLVGHALADYPLQGDFLAKAKQGSFAATGIPGWYALAMHSLIHAGFVYWFTNSVTLACIEFVGHSLIDTLKTRRHISFMVDQFLHIVMKVGYAVAVIHGAA